MSPYPTYMMKRLPVASATPARMVPMPKRMAPMVATNFGPFLSTSPPPKAAATPIMPIRIMKVIWTCIPDHPCAETSGFLNTDHA
ncbi:MAG: hypothetical protein A4E73_03744 [Syntrophaceae bacterium PtaU1.Bin231]|nr:MAG: hypothetical protein A4E73_03744 [Syntrophaceae bacterium PtaU1.Bin231]